MSYHWIPGTYALIFFARTSLTPKPPPSIANLKRKSAESTSPTKKYKKTSTGKHASGKESWDLQDQAALNRRAERFHREHQIERQKWVGNGQSSFHHGSTNTHQDTFSSASTPGHWDEPENDIITQHKIVGTCQELFKDYLRLTSEPDPKKIRPYSVLRETVDQLKSRWKQKENYSWICSQFKSVRQDLTVQGIKNEFTVNVYEIHARMALEKGDMVEYNQCQSMLSNLYDLGLGGKNRDEFAAYRILMFLHGLNRSDLNLFVGQLTSEQKSNQCVLHALNVQRALSMGNYHLFFSLYNTVPNMGGYIMDHFVERERIRALLVMAKSYISVPLVFIVNELAFENVSEALEFLSSHDCAIFTNPNHSDAEKVFDCKSASAPLARLMEEKFRKVQIKGAI